MVITVEQVACNSTYRLKANSEFALPSLDAGKKKKKTALQKNSFREHLGQPN